MTYIRCPHCGAKALNVATMCPQCRAPLSQNPMEAGPHGLEACHRCGKLVERDVEVCPFCGYHVRRGRQVRRWVGGTIAGAAVVAIGGYGLWAAGGVGGLTGWFRRTAATPSTAAAPAPSVPRPDTTVAGPDLVPDPAAPPIVAAVPSPPARRATAPVLTARYARNWANVRAGRSTDSAVVAVLRPGDRVEVGEFGRGWWAVWTDGARVGFVATDLLSPTPVARDSLP